MTMSSIKYHRLDVYSNASQATLPMRLDLSRGFTLTFFRMYCNPQIHSSSSTPGDRRRIVLNSKILICLAWFATAKLYLICAVLFSTSRYHEEIEWQILIIMIVTMKLLYHSSRLSTCIKWR
ncbi:hypothetical protein EV421DRAFT_511556 [Armillaria borealis]|uniref:Uncharacterized protein n=1 Tax=Armillaria borealis TaxID=47425 RepID=A0AA39MRQ0_9AGAR|nr:hypothetical protein EV421DRAFT_511556 [Armillaria borealis]